MQANSLSREFISEWFLSFSKYKKHKKEFSEAEPIESLPKKHVYLEEFLEEIREEILDDLISQTDSLSCKLMGSVFEIHLLEEGIRIEFHGGTTVYDEYDSNNALDIVICLPIIPSLIPQEFLQLNSEQFVNTYVAEWNSVESQESRIKVETKWKEWYAQYHRYWDKDYSN